MSETGVERGGGAVAPDAVSPADAPPSFDDMVVGAITAILHGGAERPADERPPTAATIPCDSGTARSTAAMIRSLANELLPDERKAWLAMADCLERGDVEQGIDLARRNPWAWLPLLGGDGDIRRLSARFLDHAARPRVTNRGWWALLAYPLLVAGIATLVLVVLSVTILQGYATIFDDFGMRLPLVTRLAIGLVDVFSSGWQPTAVGLAMAAAGWWIGTRWSTSAEAVAASFTRSLGWLLAWGTAPDRARIFAARAVGVGDVSRLLRMPAIEQAIGAPPPSAAAMLQAISDCQSDRCEGALSRMQWILGPVAVGVVGFVVGLIVLALFMPLVSLLSALT